MRNNYVQCLCLLLLVSPIYISLSVNGETGHLKIGAFNVRIFGASKMAKTSVVNVLVDIIMRYDIVLIQEIRDASGDAIEQLLDKINEKSPENTFAMKLSPRLGRSSSKEQYAFLYREKSGLKIDRDYVYDDGDETLNTDTTKVDTFEREPYVVLFESSATKLKRFAFAGLHIAPSDAVKELQALENVFDDIKTKLNIDDIMIMGDFNADCSYVPNYKWETIPIKSNPSYTWWIGDEADTTVANTNCAYDRFVSTGQGFETGVVNGSASVYTFDRAFQLNQTFLLDVSDHYPIEFELINDSETSDAQQDCVSNMLLLVIQCVILRRQFYLLKVF
ncbi:deoxyribonuclease-1-like [Mercenaria mercenaria]|uniref:deoxyribonuclease-1-like n=1 Tax=Mercenaria mercenaria TaxID=6596 RepID=UPI00234EE2EE|nr:deoxyribonuclease-1-like [Mercenaria mercenaria]